MSEYEHSVEKSKNNAGGGKVPPKLLRLFALYENLIQFALPLCTGIPDRPFEETPVSQSNNIVDISGVGLKQFWNLKGHMQDASTLATAHYPETLDRIFVSTSSILRGCPRLIMSDHWCSVLLPDCVELDQEVVRSHHSFKDFHLVLCDHEVHSRAIH